MDLAEDVEDRRSVVIAMSEQFPRVRYAKLAGNPDKDQPTRVVWHGLRRKTVGGVGDDDGHLRHLRGAAPGHSSGPVANAPPGLR